MRRNASKTVANPVCGSLCMLPRIELSPQVIDGEIVRPAIAGVMLYFWNEAYLTPDGYCLWVLDEHLSPEEAGRIS